MNIEDYMYYREKGVEFDLQLYDKQQISCLPSLQETRCDQLPTLATDVSHSNAVNCHISDSEQAEIGSEEEQ